MKRLLTICIFLFFTNIISSQVNEQHTKIAKLKSKIAQSENAEKLKWLDSLNTFIVKNTQKSADSVLRVSVDYALQLDSLNYAGAHLADLMDNLNNIEGQPEVSLQEFSKYKLFIKNITDAKVLAEIYLNVGDSYFYLKDYKTSNQYYDSTQVFAKRGNAKRLLALAIMYKAGTLGNEGSFAESSKNLQEAVKIFSEIRDTSNIISAKNSLSILYSKNSFFKEAKAERDEAIILAKKIKSYGHLVTFYYNAATDAQKKGNHELQIKNLKVSLDFAKRSKYFGLYESPILAGLVSAYSQVGNIAEAEKYFKELTKKPENITGSKEEDYLNAIKHLAFAKKDFQGALRYGLQHLALKRKNSSFEDTMRAEKFLSNVYEALGNDTKALVHFKNYQNIKDSISNIQNVKALSYYQTIYETEKRDLKIKAQQSDIALLDAENRQKAQWMLFGGLGLIGFFGFIILVRSMNNAKKRQRLQEAFSQGLIKAQEDERIRVARELHDSVGQKLMLLTKKTKSVGNLEMESLASDTLTELRTISRGLHPANLERLGPSAAIKAMINEVDTNTNIFFTHEIEDIDALLSKEASLHLYRIIQEVLNNMVKHADAKAASIIIEKKKDTIETTITDNGKGFEHAEIVKTSASLGMKTLLERAKILHSKIDIKSQINQGTTVSLIIPV